MVSAFANTAGGWLVSGVRDDGGVLEIAGVIEVDKVQGEFLSTLRSGGKINRRVAVGEDMVETDGTTLLVFYVPESRSGEKPIYPTATSGARLFGAAGAMNVARSTKSSGFCATRPRIGSTSSLSTAWMPTISSTRLPCPGFGGCSMNETLAEARRVPTVSS